MFYSTGQVGKFGLWELELEAGLGRSGSGSWGGIVGRIDILSA